MDPRFPAGWPFPVPQILEFIAFRDSGKNFQQFSRDFIGVFLENPRTDPGNSHSLLEFSELRKLFGPAFGRTDFSRIFSFEPPDFFADFVAGFFLLIFVGKSAQKNPPGKSPGKSSRIYTTKILRHISADWPGQKLNFKFQKSKERGIGGYFSANGFARITL